MTIRRPLLVLLLVLGSAAPAAAGNRKVGAIPRSSLAAEIRKDLRANDGAKRAWAAYLAGREGLVEVAPDIVRMLGREEDRPLKMPDLAVRAAALDALVRMDFHVPLDRLLPHARGALSAAVTILVARGHLHDTGVLTRYFDATENGDSWNWLAVGNLLHTEGVPGFAWRLLSRHRTHVTVQVRDDEGAYRGPGGEVPGCRYESRPAGYPPLVFYRLGGPPPSPKDWPKSLPAPLPRTLLADGIRPIHYRRIEGDEIWFSTSHQGPPRAPCRAEWIDAMLRGIGGGPPDEGTRRGGWWRLHQPTYGLAEGPPIRLETTLRWAGAPPLLRQIGREHRALETTFRDAVERLVKAGRMTTEEARSLRFRVRYEYRDMRRTRRQPLPDVPVFAETALFRKRPAPGDRAVLE